MGVSVWVRLKRDIEDVDPLILDGKLLAKAIDVLDRVADDLRHCRAVLAAPPPAPQARTGWVRPTAE